MATKKPLAPRTDYPALTPRRKEIDVLEDIAGGISALVTDASGNGIIDFEIMTVADANDVVGVIRRTIDADGTIAINYETLDGQPWAPVQPLRLVKVALPDNAATAALQTAGNNTLAAILAKIIAAPATAALQQSILEKLSADPATQTTLAAVLSGVNTMSSKLPSSLGIKTAAASLSIAPASDANLSRETYSTVTILNQATNAVGTTFNAFPAQACSSLEVIAGLVDLEIRRGGAGFTLTILAGSSRLMQGITNANQIQVRRKDTLNTPTTAEAEAYAV